MFFSYPTSRPILFSGQLLILLWSLLNVIYIAETIAPDSPLNHVLYNVDVPFRMLMKETKEVPITLNFSDVGLGAILPKGGLADILTLTFETKTISPQFEVLEVVGLKSIVVTRKQLEASKYIHDTNLTLHASYIGHASLTPISLEYRDMASKRTLNLTVQSSKNLLPVIISPSEGIWNTVFIVSVTIFIIISYINLGAQLDTNNIKEIIKKPKTIILGFVVSVLVMPLVSWFTGKWILPDQILYRVGLFIFACCPAASASTLWTVMLDADKELSVGLQVISTVGALFSMPLLLYFMDIGMTEEGSHFKVKVPYARLTQTLFVLTIALFIGWRFVGGNVTAKKISQKIFRPLIFFVLFFIIIFSSIIYWYIYVMFDWRITLASFIITACTYLMSGVLGQLINCNKDHSIAISVGSTYKNSGIAFAVLVVAFEPPDTYIAYVPCLTQVVSTSLSLYLFYMILSCFKCIKKRYEVVPTESTTINAETGEENETAAVKKETRSGSAGEKSIKSEENDEFIAMNVTDVVPGSPETSVKTSEHHENV